MFALAVFTGGVLYNGVGQNIEFDRLRYVLWVLALLLGSMTARTEETGQKTVTVEIRPEMRTNKLHINVHLATGAFSWSVIDPNGRIQWQDSIHGTTDFNKKQNLPLTPGEWRLEFSLDNASGKYDIKWNGAK